MNQFKVWWIPKKRQHIESLTIAFDGSLYQSEFARALKIVNCKKKTNTKDIVLIYFHPNSHTDKAYVKQV